MSGFVDAEGAVVVSGFVSKPGEIEQVRRDVAAIDGVESGQYDIKVRIWPHCEVIALLKPYRERNLNQNMGLQVTPPTGHSDRFIEGERIIGQPVDRKSVVEGKCVLVRLDLGVRSTIN